MVKKISSVPQVRAVYRIPPRKVYNANHKGDATWDKVYGRAKCIVCKKHLLEGDVYTMNNDHTLQHVGC
jgi:hypothetical protein